MSQYEMQPKKRLERKSSCFSMKCKMSYFQENINYNFICPRLLRKLTFKITIDKLSKTQRLCK